MENQLYTFKLEIDFNLMTQLSAIDRFGGSWSAIERREGPKSLKELKSIATVQSVGSSTRIEGSSLTNDEVRNLILQNVKIGKFEERDQQEVLGYFNTLDVISESYQNIRVSEGDIKNLHKHLLQFSDKDQWHKGNYKKNSNAVEATHPDGTKTIVFNTTPPGFETDDAMRNLFQWYNEDTTTPPLIRTAVFVYDFLSIHPFQDGNGRLSRLISTLLLLKHDYPWIQYISFEHEIENRKSEYYNVLQQCQQKRPGEDVTPWVRFFLSCLLNIQTKLMQKLEAPKNANQLSQREKMIYTFIENHAGCKSGEISERLQIPLPTVKKTLGEMVNANLISRQGVGAGITYTTEKLIQIQSNLMMKLTDKNCIQEFELASINSFFEIKKIILKPKFEWSDPNEWSKILSEEELSLTISCYSGKDGVQLPPIYFSSYISPYHFHPEIQIKRNIPNDAWENGKPKFLVKVKLKLSGANPEFKFDVVIVYDADQVYL